MNTLSEQQTAKNDKARLQSKFQDLNTKVNQNVDIRRIDRQTDGRMNRQMDNINP